MTWTVRRPSAALVVVCGFLLASGLGSGALAQSSSARTDALSKLTTVLADLARSVSQSTTMSTRQAGTPLSMNGMPQSVQDAARERRLRINDMNEVQVYLILTAVTDETVRQLEAAGVTIELRDAAHRRVQARLDVTALLPVAALDIVQAIRLPTYTRQRSGPFTTEGDVILNALSARQRFGLDGTGVRVGVVSDGLKGVFESSCTRCTGITEGPMATGDLPASIGLRTSSGVLTTVSGGIAGRSFRANRDLEGLPPATPPCSFAGAGAEGTALLEIVYDIVPSAKLSFANADTDIEFSQAVNFLAASSDVVLDDIGFYGLPYNGTSAVSQNTAAALNNPAYPIRAYFTSAGNDADEHYYESYVDSGVDGTAISGISTPGHLHLFQRTNRTTDVLGLGPQPYNVIRLAQGGEVSIVLTWDDAFGGSNNNYDLYLVQESTGNVVARSTDVQSGTQDPVESIDYVNATGTQGLFRIVVQNVRNAASPKNLNIFSFEPECAASGPQLLAPPAHERHNYNTASFSIAAQADAGGFPVAVTTVGAVCSASAESAAQFSDNPDESCLDTSHSTPEFFSARGPTVDGRTKPDLVAIDGVSVSGAGGFPTTFFGTSAAVPHAGGIAALLLESASCLLNGSSTTIDPTTARARIRNLLVSRARSLFPPSPNNTVGTGLMDAVAAIQQTIPSTAGVTALRLDANDPLGYSITPQLLGFTDPNGCPLVQLSWSGGCGTSPSSLMTCPIGTAVVAVSASSNGRTFSAATNVEITVTGFALSVSPATASLTAGQSASFVVTVSGDGGPYTSAVQLSCTNLPPGATCSFNPASVTPGSGSATSVLRITTITNSGVLPQDVARWFPPAGVSIATLAAWTILGAFCCVIVRLPGRARRTAVWTAACLVFVLASGSYRGSRLSGAVSIAVFPANLAFSSQVIGTTSPSKLVRVTNTGSESLSFLSIAASSEFTSDLGCSSGLEPGASCTVAVSFVPTETGPHTGTLVFYDNAAGSPQVVNLSGVGVTAPSAEAPTAPGAYDVQINGVSGRLTQSSIVSLVVEQP
jgi:hypothetical protein